MQKTQPNQSNSYTYKRYMRDGSVKEITAVVRSKKANKKPTKETK